MPVSKRTTVALSASVVLGLTVFAVTGLAKADSPSTFRTYRVTLVDIAPGQPLSPPVAATHQRGTHLFSVGKSASDQLAAVAQDGNPQPLVTALTGNPNVTRTINVGHPLTPQGRTVGTFTDSVTFTITAHPGDRFSLASMLICTNDGFVGLDGVRLPAKSRSYLLDAYDAGREQNTQMSADIPDPCSLVGPMHLAGDPNGNRDTEVASNPREPIHRHPGIKDVPGGQLTPATHGWTDPVAVVVITRLP